MKSVCRLIALVLIQSALLPSGNASASHARLSMLFPPVRLARDLHVSGHPLVGNQPQGMESPWLIWAKPSIDRPHAILSAGPLGARGSFDYFLIGARMWGTHPGGTPLLVTRAKHVARAWLAHLGAHLSQPITHVIRGSDGTIIGGSGLCCWKRSLDIVEFGGRVDTYGVPIVTNGAILYIDSTGQVVQANVRRPYLASGCRSHTTLDSRGVHVGQFCFDYQTMTELMWTSDLGGHEPYLLGPGYFAQVAAFRAHLAPMPIAVHLHRQLSPAGTAIYIVTKGKVSYRYTQVNAFLGVRFSIWPLVRIERLR